MNYARFRRATVEVNRLVKQPCTTVHTDVGPPTTTSDGHPWLVLRPGQYRGSYKTTPVWTWVKTEQLLVGDKIAFFANPWRRDESREAGWLAGMFDGEGALSFSNRGNGDTSILTIAQRLSPTLDRIKAALSERGFTFRQRTTRSELGGRECETLWVLGGRREQMRFLGMIAPQRFMDRDLSGLYEGIWAKRGKTLDLAIVTALEPDGVRQVAGLQTSTGTFITNGYLSHNSFWYYCDPAYARYVPAITARFQVSRLATGFPSAWHQAHNVSYVTANLVALKGVQPRNGGLLAWPHAGP